MKRFLVLFMALGLIVGSVTMAEAAKRSRPQRVKRTVEGTYEGPFVAHVTGCDVGGRQWGCLSVETKRGESSFTAEVVDAHGLPVYVRVSSNMDPVWGSIGAFCGKTHRSISFPEGAELFFVWGVEWAGGEPDEECPAQPTTGKISVTLSNRP